MTKYKVSISSGTTNQNYTQKFGKKKKKACSHPLLFNFLITNYKGGGGYQLNFNSYFKRDMFSSVFHKHENHMKIKLTTCF